MVQRGSQQRHIGSGFVCTLPYAYLAQTGHAEEGAYMECDFSVEREIKRDCGSLSSGAILFIV